MFVWLYFKTLIIIILTIIYVFNNIHRCIKLVHNLDKEIDNTNGDDCNLNKVDEDGYTAFHLACFNEHFQVADYLHTCGVNLQAR